MPPHDKAHELMAYKWIWFILTLSNGWKYQRTPNNMLHSTLRPFTVTTDSYRYV